MPDKPAKEELKSPKVNVVPTADGRVRIEFEIDDLVRRLLPGGIHALGHCGGCNGCTGCKH